jgi:succinate dehydrogenase / fumarate reductase, membrane anchor subunit
MKKDFRQTSRAGAVAWLLQRVTAVILFVLLIAHFITYHFLSRGQAVTYEQIMAKLAHYSLWFSLVQFLFLVTALYHGLNGVWAVIEDYVHGRGWRLTLLGILWTVGAALFFIGTLTIVQIAVAVPKGV